MSESKKAEKPQEGFGVYHVSSWGWGRKSAPTDEVLAWKSFPWYTLYASAVAVPCALTWALLGCTITPLWLVLAAVFGVVLAMPLLAVFCFVHSRMCDVSASRPLESKWISFRDDSAEAKAFAATWKGRKIPMATFYEAYIHEQVDINGDVLEALYARYEFTRMIIEPYHVKVFLQNIIPELIKHTRKQDIEQVTDHYNRGNDFYNWFLGPRMVYTSGIFNSPEDTLEQAQDNKLKIVCEKIHLKKGEKHLDIGCGWGTLVAYAAENYGTDSTGVTLAVEQQKWADKVFAEKKIQNRARLLVMDYRDIPRTRYNKITCLEMAEHVGVKNFQNFMLQVSDLLEDDGIFYLQIAGLRRAWQYEDFVWGLFMGKYIFPGADASCPLFWVVSQAEQAGYEVRSVETVGIHYSATICRWYQNWIKNKPQIVKKYNIYWFRLWEIFLAWSTVIAEHGSSTAYQIVLHKNTRAFDRRRFIAERVNYEI